MRYKEIMAKNIDLEKVQIYRDIIKKELKSINID